MRIRTVATFVRAAHPAEAALQRFDYTAVWIGSTPTSLLAPCAKAKAALRKQKAPIILDIGPLKDLRIWEFPNPWSGS
jgi:hypothetical protein